MYYLDSLGYLQGGYCRIRLSVSPRSALHTCVHTQQVLFGLKCVYV